MTRQGARAWSVVYWAPAAKTTRRLKLGDASTMPLSKARAAARAALHAVERVYRSEYTWQMVPSGGYYRLLDREERARGGLGRITRELEALRLVRPILPAIRTRAQRARRPCGTRRRWHPPPAKSAT